MVDNYPDFEILWNQFDYRVEDLRKIIWALFKFQLKGRFMVIRIFMVPNEGIFKYVPLW